MKWANKRGKTEGEVWVSVDYRRSGMKARRAKRIRDPSSPSSKLCKLNLMKVEVCRLESTVARLELKEIGGGLIQAVDYEL